MICIDCKKKFAFKTTAKRCDACQIKYGLEKLSQNEKKLPIKNLFNKIDDEDEDLSERNYCENCGLDSFSCICAECPNCHCEATIFDCENCGWKNKEIK